MHPPSEIRPAKRNNKYAEKTPQELMRKGTLMMENPPGISLASDLPFPSQIKLFLLQQCALSAEKNPKPAPCFHNTLLNLI
jgi:hypothetical protein